MAEPGSGQHEGQRGGGTVKSTLTKRAGWVAVAEQKQDEQRDPKAGCNLREVAPGVNGQQGKAGKDGCASGEGSGTVGEHFAGERAVGEAGSREQKKRKSYGDESPGHEQSQERACHPGERGVEDESRLACAEV